MQALMVTGVFQYEPCSLHLENKVLQVRLLKSDRILRISVLTEATLTRNHNGLNQLQLSTPQEQYEFLIEDEQEAKEALAALIELTTDNARLELRSVDS